jgi:hypothetical protein
MFPKSHLRYGIPEIIFPISMNPIQCKRQQQQEQEQQQQQQQQ